MIYRKHFGKAYEKETFEFIKQDIFAIVSDVFQFRDYKKYRISFIKERELNLSFVFINTRVDDSVLIERVLVECSEEFLNSFKDVLYQKFDANVFKSFDSVIYSIQNKFPPKISLVGYKGVGKTTIFNLLREQEIPVQHNSQISGDVGLLKIGNIDFQIADFTGQGDIDFFWNTFIKGSDAVIIITDSSISNIEKSRFFLQKIDEETPFAYRCVLANKQDLKEILNPSQIEEIFELKVYPSIGTNPDYRIELLEIVIETLDMFEEVAPLLKLMQNVENLIKKFDTALNGVNLEETNSIYKDIVNIWSELGENLFKMGFNGKYLEIKEKLKKAEDKLKPIISDTSKIEQQESLRTISALEGRLRTILSDYINSSEGVIGVIVSDQEGFVITSESKKDPGDESFLGAIAVTIDSFIEKIKREFGSENKFFNITTIKDKKFAYCSMGPKSILLSISNLFTPDTELRIYSEYVASKIELLLEGNIDVSLEIPEIVKILSKTKEGKIPKGNFSFKMIITGDYAVGKSSLRRRFVHNIFEEQYQSTVGVDISQKVVDLSERTKIDFIIWDVGGQIPKMVPYRKKFYEGANYAFIVIDRTRPDCIKSIDKWYDEITKSINENANIVLVDNKSDLNEELIIDVDEIKKISDKYNLHYISTSAKTGENVKEAFFYLAYKFLETV